MASPRSPDHPHLIPDCVTLRGEHHDVVRHFVVGVLLHYLLGNPPDYNLESSSGEGVHQRTMHLSSHSARPSRKRCRSPVDSVPLSTPVMGSLSPTRANLLPPRKRFRDSYSSEASIEEDAEVGPPGIGVVMEFRFGDGDILVIVLEILSR
ncbi:hypothetical protein Tco_0210680 [Tanacetum coccineum]